MGVKRNLRTLRAALDTGEPVRLARSLRKAEALDGFVVAVDEAWVLLHCLRDFRLDGWSAVRLDTVQCVQSGGPEATAARVLQVRGQRPSSIDVEPTSARRVIETMAAALPLITLNREALHPGECVIGRPHRVTKKRIHLRCVNPDAAWDAEPYRLDLADITRVDGGGDYETGLHELAGAPPPIPPDTPSVKAS